MKKFLFFTFVSLIATMGTVSAQQSYAVLIAGNMQPDSQVIPAAEQWNGGNDPHPVHGFDEFWNDTYLQWEMLIKEEGGKGFIDANVHVLFGDGEDFWFEDQDNRYKASHNGYLKVTDANSNRQTIASTFTSLASTITDDDFLFVWIMSHGGTDATGSYFYSYDNQKVYDSELAAWLGNIAAHKKVVFLSFPNSGGFLPELEVDGNIMITAGGATEGASRADDNAPGGSFTENEVLQGIAYNHGEVNYHLFSSLTGKTPKGEIQYHNTLLSAADANVDDYIAINETWNWTTNNETSLQLPMISDLGNLNSSTELEYPTLLCQTISSGNSGTYRGLIGISKTFNVNAGGRLRFINGSSIEFLKAGNRLWAEEGATIILGDDITVSSSVSLGSFVVLTEDVSIGINLSLNGKNWGDLYFGCQNPNTVLTVENMKSNGGLLAFSIGTISIINSEFSNSTLQLASYFSNCQNSTFTSSLITTYDFFSTENIIISSCTFINESNEGADYEYGAIRIEGCNSFNVENCSIAGYTVCGIYLLNSGSSSINPSNIKNVTISNIKNSNSEGTGILVYNSHVEITGLNDIFNNNYGIKSLNNSHVSILGTKNAVYVNETQQIHDNDINQIFATEGSFPYKIRFNAIYDEDNTCLVKYQPLTANEPNLEVIYNFWGLNFDPEEDLCPFEYYRWSPVWNLQFPNENIASEEQMFYTAKTLADSGEYLQAKTGYQQLVTTYPDSKYAMASLKELFVIEPSAGNDYTSLKNYYINLMNQQTNDKLVKIADFLSNLCDIRLGNYPDAISWYESVIQAPPSFADSLFAIIDLGYLYLKMEGDSLKSAPIGSMSEYKPVSAIQHAEYCDYLLSLLFKDESVYKNPETALGENKVAELFTNIPNPFRDKTTIRYAVNEANHIWINIVDYSGILVISLDEGWKEPGQYQLALTSENLVSGVYFCTIESNEMRTDSQKISVIK